MAEKPDDVPALSEIPDGADLPSYWAEPTTITVRRWVKESLDQHRDERPWSVFLEQLRQEHADPITLNDVQEIAEQVSESVGGGIDEGELALATADYLMEEYELPRKVAEELDR